ncbi:Short chain dehydrogenase citE [Cladobotryum mycophilum]|uniref:Short chain dehydrogenase citE n=1 Tax=Cladobotryum mycophilum TaxID=491253 RepID=A0ABR0SU15_9HYPO
MAASMALDADFTNARPTYTKVYRYDTYPAISPSRPELSTKGKSVVLTGAGGGIGAETALAFAESGTSHLALLGRTEKTLLATKASVNKAYPGTKVYTYVADIADHASLKTALDSFSAAVGGKLDILVSNAGYLANLSTILGSEPGDWWSGFEINVKGNYNLTRAFIPVARSDATLIHVSSGGAHLPHLWGHSSYQVSKMAATRFYESLQAEHPELKVMQFHPGVVETPMRVKSFQGKDARFQLEDVKLAASFAVWSASEEARFLRGKFVWASWDVEELKAKASELERDPETLVLRLKGWE